MKTKTIDCMALKRAGAENVRAAVAGLTREQEVAFWQRRSEELRRRQEALARGAAGSVGPGKEKG